MKRPPAEVVDRVRQRLAALGIEPTPHSVAEALRADDRLWGTTTVLVIVGGWTRSASASSRGVSAPASSMLVRAES